MTATLQLEHSLSVMVKKYHYGPGFQGMIQLMKRVCMDPRERVLLRINQEQGRPVFHG